MGMASESSNIQTFWRWFADHQPELHALSHAEEAFWDVALEHLKKVDGRLWFELSEKEEEDDCRDFVVTAEGYVEAFPVVEALIAVAPAIEGWRFLALKPAMGFDFTTRYEGVLFDPGLLWFLPLGNPPRADYLGLRIAIPGLQPADERRAHNAVLVILDTALGERSAALDIQYTEVIALPPEPESLGYIELPELAEYISWRKRKLGFSESK
jgi:hypothetical protein